MPVRAAKRRFQASSDDFVGDGRFEQTPYDPLGPASARSWTFRGPEGPAVPPPIEDAVLMAISELFEWEEIYDKEARKVSSFDWSNPNHWWNFSWPRDIAVYLLRQFTLLNDTEIGELLGFSGSRASHGRRDCADRLAKATRTKKPTDFQKRYLETIFAAAKRAEEISECPLMWLDGWTVEDR
jgi:hypothetical protein